MNIDTNAQAKQLTKHFDLGYVVDNPSTHTVTNQKTDQVFGRTKDNVIYRHDRRSRKWFTLNADGNRFVPAPKQIPDNTRSFGMDDLIRQQNHLEAFWNGVVEQLPGAIIGTIVGVVLTPILEHSTDKIKTFTLEIAVRGTNIMVSSFNATSLFQ